MTKELAQLKRDNETGKGRMHWKCLTAENTHKQKDVYGLHGFKQWGEGSLGITTNEALQKLAIFTQFYKHVT